MTTRNRLKTYASLCLPLLLAASCGGSDKPAPTPPAPVQDRFASHGLRIDNPVLVPQSYDLVLRLDPAAERFNGMVTIPVQVLIESRDFYLNGRGLEIANAELEQNGQNSRLEVALEDEDWLHFTAPAALPKGNATLRIYYTGLIDDSSSFGVFRQKSAEDAYIYTQFEARGARRALPSMDQPNNKVPWTLAIQAPQGMVALANTPEVETRPAEDGFVHHQFAQSKPLPSYLLAFAVGPFDMVEIGNSRSGVPVRVAAPKGRGGETGWVKESTLPLLQILEDYLGSAYPYAKLDLVAVPNTGSFGAMENPGLITYTETLLLSKDEPLSFKKAYAAVGAHELAHQWFGNLVTNAWWDDLWLNESFATWMSAKTVHAFRPEWGSDVAWIERRASAMGADRLASARVIHQPIEVEGDIGAAFDGITYAKGASVLTMFEGWLGEETFQTAIQHYLRENAYRNATAARFLSAMDAKTEGRVSKPFSSFLDQAGTPLVHMELACAAGAIPSINLKQERYAPMGSTIDKAMSYTLPVCVRYPVGAESATVCTLLGAPTANLALEKAEGCPEWVVPNAGAKGYYRAHIDPAMVDRMVSAKEVLEVPEILALADDRRALVSAGLVPLDAQLAMAAQLARSRDERVLGAAAKLASVASLAADEDLPRYRKWLKMLFGSKARSLGFRSGARDSATKKSLRQSLLSLMIFEVEDLGLRAQGRAMAKKWLKDPTKADPDLSELALKAAARWGDEALVDQLIAFLKSSSDRSRRRLVLAALGSLKEDGLADKALALMLDPEIDVRESQRLLFALAGSRSQGHRTFHFVLENIEALKERFGDEMGTRLARVASAQCKAEFAGAYKTFLDQHIRSIEGGGRAADQAQEKIDLCLAAKAALSLPPAL